jgi:hypothetical protein
VPSRSGERNLGRDVLLLVVGLYVVFRMFLYQLLSGPLTGARYSVSPSCTNHTGLEISRPDVRR